MCRLRRIAEESTPFEAQLQELLDRVSGTMAHDIEKIQAMAALQGRVYAEIDSILRRYIAERDSLLTGYRTHREVAQ